MKILCRVQRNHSYYLFVAALCIAVVIVVVVVVAAANVRFISLLFLCNSSICFHVCGHTHNKPPLSFNRARISTTITTEKNCMYSFDLFLFAFLLVDVVVVAFFFSRAVEMFNIEIIIAVCSSVF